MTARKTLVIYYSDSGHTRAAAQADATALDATVEELKARYLWGPIGYFQRGRQGMSEKPANIGPVAHDPADFDLVVIGTPVWGWHLSGPVRAYLMAHGPAIKQAAYIITMGGQGAETAAANMTALLGKEPLTTVAISDADRKSGDDKAKVDGFVSSLALQ